MTKVRAVALAILLTGCGGQAMQGRDAAAGGRGGDAPGGRGGAGGAGGSAGRGGAAGADTGGIGGGGTGGGGMGGGGTGGGGSGGGGSGGGGTGGGGIGGGGTGGGGRGGGGAGGGGTGGGGLGGGGTGGGGAGRGGTGGGGMGGGGTGGGGTGGGSLRDRFPATRPATITVTGRITKNDLACVIVGTAGGCLAQNTPPCSPEGGQSNTMLDLTIDAQDNITVEAPYQTMCAQDYFCAISGPNCPIPTSYPVPLVNQRYLYNPRPTDNCRRDTSSVPIQVEHLVDVTVNGNVSLTIRQQCHTRMRNDGTTPSSYVNDSRDWTTVVTF